MKVRAKQLGFYNHTKRKEGVVFELEPIDGLDPNGKPKHFSVEDQFSEAWMERVEDDVPISKPGKKQPQRKTGTEG